MLTWILIRFVHIEGFDAAAALVEHSLVLHLLDDDLVLLLKIEVLLENRIVLLVADGWILIHDIPSSSMRKRVHRWRVCASTAGYVSLLLELALHLLIVIVLLHFVLICWIFIILLRQTHVDVDWNSVFLEILLLLIDLHFVSYGLLILLELLHSIFHLVLVVATLVDDLLLLEGELRLFLLHQLLIVVVLVTLLIKLLLEINLVQALCFALILLICHQHIILGFEIHLLIYILVCIVLFWVLKV